MSNEGAPQKQIPFDELEIVHVQSQDPEARTRKEEGTAAWMSGLEEKPWNNPQSKCWGVSRS